LCSFQWALWQSLLQYLTRPQREQLNRVGSWRSQWAQASASSLEEGFFFLGGMALGGEEKKGEGLGKPQKPPITFFLRKFQIDGELTPPCARKCEIAQLSDGTLWPLFPPLHFSAPSTQFRRHQKPVRCRPSIWEK